MGSYEQSGFVDSGADIFGEYGPAMICCAALILAGAIAMVSWAPGRAWGMLPTAA